LYLVVYPSGMKSWAFRYRYRGRTRKLTFEPYPQMSLLQARAEAEARLDDLEDDKDPAVVQAEEIAETVPTSARAVAEEWIKRHLKDAAESTQLEYARILHKDILPFWKDSGEAGTIQWKHIDLDQGLWTIPPELHKSGKLHVVPLSTAAVELLKSLPRFTKDYVFTTTGGAKPISLPNRWEARFSARDRFC
jgi:integrase